MSHLILLGDSIFDNAADTKGGPDIVMQLNDLLPVGGPPRCALGDRAQGKIIP